eukprot:4239893-Amphidinium_carterae.3
MVPVAHERESYICSLAFGDLLDNGMNIVLRSLDSTALSGKKLKDTSERPKFSPAKLTYQLIRMQESKPVLGTYLKESQHRNDQSTKQVESYRVMHESERRGVSIRAPCFTTSGPVQLATSHVKQAKKTQTPINFCNTVGIAGPTRTVHGYLVEAPESTN